MTEGNGPRGRGITRHQFDEVMRRATELASQSQEGDGPDVSEDELFRIAGEVGLDAKHVRAALTEIRSGVPDNYGAGEHATIFDRLYGPANVRTSRVIPGTPKELGRKLDEYMVGGRLLQRVRRGPVVLQYRPSVDWMSQIARAASGTARRYYLASAKSVEIHLHQIDEENTQVEIVVDPGIQGDYSGGAIVGSFFGGIVAAGGTYGATAAFIPEVGAVLAGLAAAGGLTAAITAWTRSIYRKKWSEVLSEVEGVLDVLQMDEPLKPPPPSWRKWVERQFHGARRLLDIDGDSEAEGPP